MNEPDYDNYTYYELVDVRSNIDGGKFPERKQRVERLLSEKFSDGPPQIGPRYIGKYETFWARFWASILDGIVVGILGAVVSTLVASLPQSVVPGAVLFVDVLPYIYVILLHHRFGQTLGKMATEVKVVSFPNEGALTMRRAFVRDGLLPVIFSTMLILGVFLFVDDFDNAMTAFALFIGLYFGWYLLELVTMLSNKKRRALHDYIAGTVVINIGTHVRCEGRIHANSNA